MSAQMVITNGSGARRMPDEDMSGRFFSFLKFFVSESTQQIRLLQSEGTVSTPLGLVVEILYKILYIAQKLRKFPVVQIGSAEI